MNEELWLSLFNDAMTQIDASSLSPQMWRFGGGTVLMQKFNHRLSKDIDIFVHDPQFLSYISPRANGALESKIVDFIEQYNYTKIYLPEGEIDFILAKQISTYRPILKIISDRKIFVEHPVEIIAKKIHYRASEFTSRDLFDLAVVYSKIPTSLVKGIEVSNEVLTILNDRIDFLSGENIFNDEMNNLNLLDGAKYIRGNEINLCKKFINALFRNLENGKTQSKSLSR